MRYKRTISLIFMLLVSGQSYASNIIYTVDRTVGGTVGGAATVVGTITTDGTMGVLDDANIVDFSLVLNDGTYNVPISDANGGTHFAISLPGVDPGGSPMTATATQLLFDFTSSGVVHFQLDPTDDGTPFWCLSGSTSHCLGFNDASNAESIRTSKDPSVFYIGPELGSAVVVANVALSQVPLPAAAWLFGSALLGLGALKRKKA